MDRLGHPKILVQAALALAIVGGCWAAPARAGVSVRYFAPVRLEPPPVTSESLVGRLDFEHAIAPRYLPDVTFDPPDARAAPIDRKLLSKLESMRARVDPIPSLIPLKLSEQDLSASERWPVSDELALPQIAFIKSGMINDTDVNRQALQQLVDRIIPKKDRSNAGVLELQQALRRGVVDKPGMPEWVVIAFTMVLLGLGMVPIVWFIKQRRSDGRFKICLYCGHSLRYRDDQCPECGAMRPAEVARKGRVTR